MGEYPFNPLLLKTGQSGDFEIKEIVHPAGTTLETSNLRTALFGGQPQQKITYEEETTWHSLREDGGIWMTDLPIEQAQHLECLDNMRGRVLIGGLGLGLAVTLLQDTADEIVVIEKSLDVINLVGPSLPGWVEVINADLMTWKEEWRRTDELEFDNAFFDIWQSDGERTFHTVVKPLRQLYDNVADNIVCWNEDVMRGQLSLNLSQRLAYMDIPKDDAKRVGIECLNLEELSTLRDSIYWDWCVPFFKTIAKIEDESLHPELARQYAGVYGRSPSWRYSWNRMIQEATAV